VGNNVDTETPRGGVDIGGPGGKAADQSVIVGSGARYEKVHNVGDVLGSTHIPRRRGSLVSAASDLDIRHLWLSRSRYGQQYKHGGVMTGQIPLVDYLVLDDGDPHLVAQECTNCGARFFDRRNACASCFASEFTTVAVPTEGTVRAFTIVTFAAPGIPTPFVASVVDCDGTQVRTNLVNVEPDPEHIRDGMKVRLATFAIGSDSAGTEAIGFGFEPAT
jgi:uncharacterized protein